MKAHMEAERQRASLDNVMGETYRGSRLSTTGRCRPLRDIGGAEPGSYWSDGVSVEEGDFDSAAGETGAGH